MTRIFISYASADRPLADRLCEALSAKGCTVWMDRKTNPGSRWDRELEHELLAASTVVVLWTRNSRDREWVLNEASVAMKRNTLFPVIVDDAEPPLEFLRHQAVRISFSAPHIFEQELVCLAEKIAKANASTAQAISEQREPLHLGATTINNKRYMLLALLLFGIVFVRHFYTEGQHKESLAKHSDDGGSKLPTSAGIQGANAVNTARETQNTSSIPSFFSLKIDHLGMVQ